MRTVASTIEVQRSGVQSESVFTIKATSKAFDILSSGLYSDKIRAIVRELSCNAYDSHVAAGNPEKPIEVKLPTYLDQTFYVKDFGTGLSHEDIQHVYTTYFESTKTESDDFIGQLGLGSKSPFSYASTFTVESRFNGMKSVYTCHKNEAGMPAITLMGAAPTDEPNGLTVALSVKRDDVDKFTDAARKVYMYFDPVPNVLGHKNFVPHTLKHTVQGTKWKVRESEWSARMNGAYVIQGFVAYPVDVAQLVENGLKKNAKRLANTNIDLYVDIGQVEVAASREALSYDARTIANLIKALEDASTEVRGSIQKKFDECTTKWEARQLMGHMGHKGAFAPLIADLHEADPFKWNGKPVEEFTSLDMTNIQTTCIRRMGLTHKSATAYYTWTPDNLTKKIDTFDLATRNMHVVIDTEAKGFRDVSMKVLSALQNVDGASPSLILLSPTSKKLFSQKEIDLIVDQLGNPPVSTVDDLGIIRTKGVSTYKKREPEAKMCWAGFPEYATRWGGTETRKKFSRLCWNTETIDLNDGGYYVDVERFTIVNSTVNVNRIDQFIEKAKELGLIANDAKVYGMSAVDKKHIAGITGWVNLFDHVKAEFNKANANDVLFSKVIADGVVSVIGRAYTLFVSDWTRRADELVDGSFKTFMDKISQLIKSAPKVDSTAVQTMADLLDVTSNVSTKVNALEQEWRSMLKNYSMLSLINWSAINGNDVDKIVEYINVIDRV